MKLQSKIALAAIFATAIATSAFAGPVGTARTFQTAQPDSATVAELQDAAQQARHDAMTGNKNNLAFRPRELPDRTGDREDPEGSAGRA